MRQRRWHVLKRNARSSKPVCHLFVDIECKVEQDREPVQAHSLWFGWACYWRRRPERETDTIQHHRFTTIDEFWQMALSYVQPNKPLYLVSHNTSYDFGILKIFEHLTAAGFEMYSPYIGGLTVIMRFRRGNEKIILLDNCNFFTGSLGSLGAAIGFDKMDVDPLTATEAEADPYCKRDVDILVKLWQEYYEFLDIHDLGSWGSTVPSQAFRAYRHRFMPHKIVIHADFDALELEREAYHGGRTSVFWTGKSHGQQFYKVDVNSMYPYVMTKHEFPCQFYGLRDHLTLDGVRKKMRRFQVIARVTINTDVPVYPVMLNKHLVHPVGRFDTVLTTPEVEFALARGHLERVHTVALYEHAELFSQYVDFFYRLKSKYRESANKPFYLMSKLYLNALYGKFGQKSETWELFDDPPPEIKEARMYYNARTKETWRLYRFGDQVWKARSSGESNNSFPAIAAHVTAYARLYLWKLIMKAGREHVYYTDTDSLIVDKSGLVALDGVLDDTTLGALKIEEQTDDLEIVCPKHYRMGDDWKRKGIPTKAVALGGEVFKCTQFPSFKTQARQEADHPFETRTVIKHLTGNIFDGTPDDRGWVVPVDAGELVPEMRLSIEDRERIERIEAQTDALHESEPVHPSVVFKLWDYRAGKFKGQRDKYGDLVMVEYSNWDAKATELGFDDLDALQDAILDYLDIRRRVRALNAERMEILYPSPSSDTLGELVF